MATSSLKSRGREWARKAGVHGDTGWLAARNFGTVSAAEPDLNPRDNHPPVVLLPSDLLPPDFAPDGGPGAGSCDALGRWGEGRVEVV